MISFFIQAWVFAGLLKKRPEISTQDKQNLKIPAAGF